MTHTGHGASLLRQVCQTPDDDTPRLAYADWCGENGDPDRAEFIQLQIELARCGPPHKKTHYHNIPTALRKHGDRHYSFTGYRSDGFAVGDRVDLLVHRALRKPKMVQGLRVYRLIPYDGPGASDGELDVYVRLDAESGPWKGAGLEARCNAFLAANAFRWRSGPVCPCQTREGTYATEVAYVYGVAYGPAACPNCRGTGYSGSLAERVPGDGTKYAWAVPAEWSRGFIGEVTTAAVRLVTDDGEWSARLFSEWPVTRVVPFDRVPEPEPVDVHGDEVDGYYWQRDGREHFPEPLRSELVDAPFRLPPPIFNKIPMTDRDRRIPHWEHNRRFATADEAVRAASAACVAYGRGLAGLD